MVRAPLDQLPERDDVSGIIAITISDVRKDQESRFLQPRDGDRTLFGNSKAD